MSRTRSYEGDAIEVTFDPARCIHSEECVRGLPSVFDPDRRPWVDADAAEADAIAEVIHRCPTGALAYRRRDGRPEEKAPAEASIRVAADGPLFARGPFRLRVPGEEEPREEIRIALCRCGLSEHKPFCDDSHVEGGFEAEAALGTPGKLADGEASAEGPIEIVPRENGPLTLDAAVELSDGGSERLRCRRPALCRCGHSANKPFCDGSHGDAGFAAEGF